MTKERIQIIIKTLKEETDPDELYSLLIDCGKNYDLNEKEKEALKSVIVEYCNFADEMVRSAAIQVLCFYWGMKEFRNKAYTMFLKDSDDGTRADSLASWANTYRNSNNEKTLNSLIHIIKDKNESGIVRATAYGHFFNVSLLLPKDWPKLDIDWDNIESEIDWELIEHILRDK